MIFVSASWAGGARSTERKRQRGEEQSIKNGNFLQLFQPKWFPVWFELFGQDMILSEQMWHKWRTCTRNVSNPATHIGTCSDLGKCFNPTDISTCVETVGSASWQRADSDQAQSER